MNVMKTTLLLGLLSGLLIFGGVVIAGERGLVYGLVMAVTMNFFSCFFSEKMALMSAREGNVVRQRAEEDWAPEPQPDWRLADDLAGADGSRVDTNGNFRTREFSADATSAHVLGTAQPMISALEKLDSLESRDFALDVPNVHRGAILWVSTLQIPFNAPHH